MEFSQGEYSKYLIPIILYVPTSLSLHTLLYYSNEVVPDPFILMDPDPYSCDPDQGHYYDP